MQLREVISLPKVPKYISYAHIAWAKICIWPYMNNFSDNSSKTPETCFVFLVDYKWRKNRDQMSSDKIMNQAFENAAVGIIIQIDCTFCFEKPGSITNTTPSIVSDVSAIFVETTTLRPIAPFDLLGGALSKILCWRLGGNVEYNGIHFRSPISGPRFSISLFILLQASSISYENQKYIIKPWKYTNTYVWIANP